MSNGVYQCPGCGEICMDSEPCYCKCPPPEPYDWRTEMPRCATCQHWDQTSQLRDLALWDKMRAEGRTMYRTRESDLKDAEFGNCAKLHDNDLVKNQDHVDQWWDTPLQTHKSFGCILWESKDD